MRHETEIWVSLVSTTHNEGCADCVRLRFRAEVDAQTFPVLLRLSSGSLYSLHRDQHAIEKQITLDLEK